MVVVGQPVAKLGILDSTQPPIQPPPGNGPACLHYSTAIPHPPRRMRMPWSSTENSSKEKGIINVKFGPPGDTRAGW